MKIDNAQHRSRVQTMSTFVRKCGPILNDESIMDVPPFIVMVHYQYNRNATYIKKFKNRASPVFPHKCHISRPHFTVSEE